MRKVFGIGETVLDIVFRNGQPEAAVPGGSTFNSMITLGRCGIDATLLSEVGNDRVGSMIKDFMVKNGVHTEQINTLQAKSPVSLAFLNDRNEAEYSFYRDKLEEHPDFVHPELEPDDIVLFGSFYALNPVTRPQLKGFLEYARERGALFITTSTSVPPTSRISGTSVAICGRILNMPTSSGAAGTTSTPCSNWRMSTRSTGTRSPPIPDTSSTRADRIH